MSRRSIIVAAAAIPLVILFDQLTKWLIWHSYGPAGTRIESEYLGGLVRLHFVRNTGSAFGLFQGQTALLILAAFLAIGFIVYFFLKLARDNVWASLALSLLVGGAIGNLIDRVRLGYVIDWVKLPITLSFNLADAAIAAGMALLFLSIIIHDMRAGVRETPDAEPPARSSSVSTASED